MKIPFNANDFAFLKQHNSKQKISKKTIPPKNKILKNSKKQKDMRIDINDRFKDFLKQLSFNSNLNNILAPVYMNIRMMCKEPLIMYSHFFQKDFFSNKPKARIVSEADMTEFQKQKERHQKGF